MPIANDQTILTTDLLPAHKCSLHLGHNAHHDVYQSASDWCKHNDEYGTYEWQNEEAKQRAIATGEIWTMKWYPNTPVGFNAVAAPTLQELLSWGLSCQ